MAQKKGLGEEEVPVPLQAVLLADSFTQKFRPITLERPKVLLPLANVPMIEYALAWLESVGVAEVFVFCCSHANQVKDYLQKSQWLGQSRIKVDTIESHDSISAGDALRLIYEKNVIRGDFVLISGDTVSNMSLADALQEHKQRRKKDPLAVMTMVIKQSKPSSISCRTRLGNDELFIGIDPESNELLYYEDRADYSKGLVSLDKTLLSERPAVLLQNDKQDCYIDICSPEVLSLFTDNFDYQQLRRDFVKGLLMDDIMGYKIFTYEIGSSYAARIENFRSYDTVSKDILQRWMYPFVPDVQFSGNCPAVKMDREGIYRANDVAQSRFARVGPYTLVGAGTSIGDYSCVINSTIGDNCTIGRNVSIEGCYIWNNVTIQDNCKLKHAIVCDGAILKAGAVLQPGVILTFKVMLGEDIEVPAYSKISLLHQPNTQDSDEELEYADSSHGIVENPSLSGVDENGELVHEPSEDQHWDTSKVGVSGAGVLWSIGENLQEDEWKHSIAPIPAEKLGGIIAALADAEASQDLGTLQTSEGVKANIERDVDEDGNSVVDDDVDLKTVQFDKEVEETFARAVVEGVEQDHVILEINALRLAYNMTFSDCAGAIFDSLIKLALEPPRSSNRELLINTKNVIVKWKGLLSHYVQSEDDEVEILLKLEEICLESAKEFASIFSSILQILYDQDIVTEDAIMSWASEKEGAEESDKVFVNQCEAFIQWLREASEEE
ncbi:uncharacterized protein LOC116264101 [Nymphaea colorata]|nr:uncharacterized protein LOC116264101 [Nymphaea colorata]